jgi:hypothetical protein
MIRHRRRTREDVRHTQRRGPQPDPQIIAAAELDYHALCASVSTAMHGARQVMERSSEVEAFAEVYYALTRINPRVANAMGAAAIMQLAMSPQDRRAQT